MEHDTQFYIDNVIIPVKECSRDLTKDNALEHEYHSGTDDNFLENMCRVHGYDIVATVFSAHIKAQSFDGRYTREVKNWAQSYQTKLPVEGMPNDFPDKAMLGNTHPVIINSYAAVLIHHEKELREIGTEKQENTVSGSAVEQLYDKMYASQESFRGWLLQQKPEEILNHTYEYTVREDILMIVESGEIDEKTAEKLLENDAALDEIFDKFNDKERDYMEELKETFFEVAKGNEKIKDDLGKD